MSIAAREAQIAGDGPRIAPLPVDALTPDLLAIIGQMVSMASTVNARESLAHLVETDGEGEAPAYDLGDELARLPEIVPTMLRHPDLFAKQTEIGIDMLTRGTLSGRDRELAVLRMAWLCQAPYEWGEHVHVARTVGIDPETVERVTEGSGAAGWTRHERAILCAVKELRDDAMITDATWAVLAETLDERQLIELPVLIGQYQAVAYYQNTLRLRLHPGNDGLRAR